jgi:hypothetical protein
VKQEQAMLELQAILEWLEELAQQDRVLRKEEAGEMAHKLRGIMARIARPWATSRTRDGTS